MLLLTIGVGDQIRIGEGDDAIVVKVQRRYGNKVQLGVSAPLDVRVTREHRNKKPQGDINGNR